MEEYSSVYPTGLFSIHSIPIERAIKGLLGADVTKASSIGFLLGSWPMRVSTAALPIYGAIDSFRSLIITALGGYYYCRSLEVAITAENISRKLFPHLRRAAA